MNSQNARSGRNKCSGHSPCSLRFSRSAGPQISMAWTDRPNDPQQQGKASQKSTTTARNSDIVFPW
jgi:hypothetical protein